MKQLNRMTVGTYDAIGEWMYTMLKRSQVMRDKKLPRKSSRSDVNTFLNKVASMPQIRAADKRGRLIFSMDATASREPTWDRACHIQGQMFQATHSLGGLEVQLCYYHAFNIFRVSNWCGNTLELRNQMAEVPCLAGHTQIGKVLQHTIDETKRKRVNALVFVGDCMEEDPDYLFRLAGTIGLLNIPIFVFHEGDDAVAAKTFREIARLSGGAYCYFNAASAQQLKDLLEAVAVYAAGGRKALEAFSEKKGESVRLIVDQMKRG